MGKCRANIAGFGIEDRLIASVNLPELEIARKGDIWNKRPGKKYEENIITITSIATYEKGFGSAIDKSN